MKERPILDGSKMFSDPMVLAILDGSKTQMRRVMKPQPRVGGNYVECTVCHKSKKPHGRDAPAAAANGYCDLDCDGNYAAPYADHLWPGESLGDFGFPEDWMGPCPYGVPGDRLWVRDRLTLEITEVRAQRVQSISENDAIAEGVVEICEHRGPYPNGCESCMNTGYIGDPEDAFEAYWDSINVPGSKFDDNPWIRAITFKRILQTETT